MTGPFDPVAPSAAAKPVALPQWRPILPVPADAPALETKHSKHGAAAKVWRYHDRRGQLVGAVCRYNLPDGNKEIRTAIYAEHAKFGRQWRFQGFPRPRPIFNLDQLAARPEASVLIVEGEKSCDAAAVLLPDHVAITSPGGNSAAKLADWSALAGRDVTIWPDSDPAGAKYAAAVAALLLKLMPAPTVAIIAAPEGVAKGWDAADAASEGWDTTRAAELVAAAVPLTLASDESGPRERKSSRDQLLELIAEDVELWSNDGVGFASVIVDDHRENYEINSRGFRGYLSWRAYEATGISPPSEALEAALRTAETISLNRGPRYPIWRRVAAHDGKIFIDLGCRRWRVVEIRAGGWQVLDTAPAEVKFLRSRGMGALPEPEAGELLEGVATRVPQRRERIGFSPHCRLAPRRATPEGPVSALGRLGRAGISEIDGRARLPIHR